MLLFDHLHQHLIAVFYLALNRLDLLILLSKSLLCSIFCLQYDFLNLLEVDFKVAFKRALFLDEILIDLFK